MFKRIFLYFCAALPLLAIVGLIARFSVNVPFLDQWDGLVEYLQAMHSGGLQFKVFWAQHNEHRLVFPKLLMLGLASLSKWDVRWEMYGSVAIQTITFVLVVSLLRITGIFKTSRHLNSVSLVLAGGLLFSLAQHQNFFWGWQIQIFMNILGACLCLWALTKWPGSILGLAVGAAGAILATYSFANGLLIWWVAGFYLFCRERAVRNWQVLTWGTLSLLFSLTYMIGYETPAHTSDTVLVNFERILDVSVYVLAYLGAPFGIWGGFSFSALTGYAGLVLLIVAVRQLYDRRRRHIDHRYLPWLALSIYSLLSAIITGIGRAEFGITQALASRYTTISTLFWIGTLFLFLVAAGTFGGLHIKKLHIGEKIIAAAVLLVLAMCYGLCTHSSLKIVQDQSAYLTDVYRYLNFNQLYMKSDPIRRLLSKPQHSLALNELRSMKIGPFNKESPFYSLWISSDLFSEDRPAQFNFNSEVSGTFAVWAAEEKSASPLCLSVNRQEACFKGAFNKSGLPIELPSIPASYLWVYKGEVQLNKGLNQISQDRNHDSLWAVIMLSSLPKGNGVEQANRSSS